MSIAKRVRKKIRRFFGKEHIVPLVVSEVSGGNDNPASSNNHGGYHDEIRRVIASVDKDNLGL